MSMDTTQKLLILTAAARSDLDCQYGEIATDLPGCCRICAGNGRQITLLKILFSNACVYDCAYCANRRGNDIPRATFTVAELVELTLALYRRGRIGGLFLTSAVWRTPDNTQECLNQVAETLRFKHQFRGYIHLKVIPGADPALIRRAGLVADRVSVNIELPTEQALTNLAPDKSRHSILAPMLQIGTDIAQDRQERRNRYVTSGQTSQLIVGASPESDRQILLLSQALYQRAGLQRMYYSAYRPVNHDRRLPQNPLPQQLREHRLYQADWLLRFYGFQTEELLPGDQPELDPRLDPKTVWALRHPECFPVEVNTAPYTTLLRTPGIGPVAARRIIAERRYRQLAFSDLRKLGVITSRARYFLAWRNEFFEASPEKIRALLLPPEQLQLPGF